MNRTFHRYSPFLLTLLIIFLDRLTKQIVATTMDLHQSIPFLGDAVRWTYIHNDGMVFGMEIMNPRILGVLSLIAVIVIIAILVRMPQNAGALRWILAAILGGAIGNTYDRLAWGYVIDFVDVNLPDFIMERFAVFNIADSAVSVGVTILLLMLLFDKGVSMGEVAESLPSSEAQTESTEPIDNDSQTAVQQTGTEEDAR